MDLVIHKYFLDPYLILLGLVDLLHQCYLPRLVHHMILLNVYLPLKVIKLVPKKLYGTVVILLQGGNPIHVLGLETYHGCRIN